MAPRTVKESKSEFVKENLVVEVPEWTEDELKIIALAADLTAKSKNKNLRFMARTAFDALVQAIYDGDESDNEEDAHEADEDEDEGDEDIPMPEPDEEDIVEVEPEVVSAKQSKIRKIHAHVDQKPRKVPITNVPVGISRTILKARSKKEKGAIDLDKKELQDQMTLKLQKPPSTHVHDRNCRSKESGLHTCEEEGQFGKDYFNKLF